MTNTILAPSPAVPAVFPPVGKEILQVAEK